LFELINKKISIKNWSNKKYTGNKVLGKNLLYICLFYQLVDHNLTKLFVPSNPRIII